MALARLASGRFAPGGHLPVVMLAVCACGLLVALFSVRPPSQDIAVGSRAGRPDEQSAHDDACVSAFVQKPNFEVRTNGPHPETGSFEPPYGH